MPYIRVNVGTDLWGIKDNVELIIDPTTTTSAQLANLIERTLTAEQIARCPSNISMRDVPPFRIISMLILVDNSTQQWEEVTSATPLFDGCQLFVFQPRHPFHSDAQGALPPPRSVGSVPMQLTPKRQPDLTPLDLAHIAFAMLDRRRNGIVPIPELKATLLHIGLDISELKEGFIFDDRTKETITFREWLSFADVYPNLVALIAQSCGGVEPPDHYQMGSPRRNSIGGSVIANKELSPPRHGQTRPEQRQRLASERLSAGLSCIATGKDRKREADEDAEVPLSTSMEAQMARNASIKDRVASRTRAASPKRKTTSRPASPATTTPRKTWVLHR